jgi:hypothetical protein
MKYINIIFIILIIGEIITSCGGSSGSKNIDFIRKVKGAVVDGYISEANITIYNKKYKLSENNITDINGSYIFYINSNISNIDIISHGGEDTMTKEVFEGELQAKVIFDKVELDDEIYITPLSTLLAIGSKDNEDSVNVSKIIKYNLDIYEDFNLVTDNPMSDNINNELKLNIFQGIQQVQKVTEIISDTLGKNINYEKIFKAIYLTMANNYNNKNREIFDKHNILTSNILRNNIIKLAVGDKNKNINKLNAISLGLKSMVDIIYDTNMKYEKIKLNAMAIELVSNSYEEKAKQIDKAINENIATLDLVADVSDIKDSYISLDKMIDVVKLANNKAINSKEVVSLPLLAVFLSNKISSDGVDGFNEKGINTAIESGVVSKTRKNEINWNIIQGNPTDAIGGDDHAQVTSPVKYAGGRRGGGGDGGDEEESISKDKDKILIYVDDNSLTINDSNKSDYPAIPNDKVQASNIKNTTNKTSNKTGNIDVVDQNVSDEVVVPDLNKVNINKVPDINQANIDKIPELN